LAGAFPEDEEVHSYVNELASSLGTYLYGRKMYDTMGYWEIAHTILDDPQFVLDWAGWNRRSSSSAASPTAWSSCDTPWTDFSTRDRSPARRR
jgi:hypothetical protein